MNKNIKINFILPFKPRRPAGGFRVMYEYANRLAFKGYDIHLTYPIDTPYMKYRLPYPIRAILTMVEGFKRNRWFDFHPSITMSYVPEIAEEYVIDANIVIATWWSTVLEMGKLSQMKGKKINLIQGFENWEGHEDLLYQSYNLRNTTNIVVASFLKEIVEKHTSKKPIIIRNAINNKEFHLKTDLRRRIPASIAMNYSDQEIKGSRYGLEALYIVKQKYPELKVDLFSTSPQPSHLPNWMVFRRNPDNLCDIYNRNAIFISNSLTEGFSLVSAESLACGCALICTNIPGHREFAIDGETAILVETKNAQQMAEKICFLIENNEKRINLANQGNKHIQDFGWDTAVKKMEDVIKNELQI